MPIYEYQCTSCEAITDIKHGFKETTSQTCPACGGVLKRVFRPAGIVFKGSGFYVTDSRKARDDSTAAAGAAKSGA
ncbi:MAG: FmdB family transcriptional regulator, partial [Candidatus Eremiobacteraeota bacterium]|nr:FmdB family transcriptional regulator [Candidatus Eremiobacteraeota bacterium]